LTEDTEGASEFTPQSQLTVTLTPTLTLTVVAELVTRPHHHVFFFDAVCHWPVSPFGPRANWRHHSELLPYAVALVAIVAGLIVFGTSTGGEIT
jgi:hypothetical protein